MTSRIIVILILNLVIKLAIAASPDNLLANPYFDNDVSEWQPSFTTPGWNPDDADGLDYSGSMELLVGGDIPLGANQCVSVGTADEMLVSVDARRSDGAVSSFVNLGVVWYSEAHCLSGTTISNPSYSEPIGPDWRPVRSIFTRPA